MTNPATQISQLKQNKTKQTPQPNKTPTNTQTFKQYSIFFYFGGHQVDTLEGKYIIQRDLERVEEWACLNLMKSKGPNARSCA